METKKRFVPKNKIVFTNEMLDYIKHNFNTYTNHQLAIKLGITLTVLRNMTRELGLKHIELQYWTLEQINYLKENYKTKGDTEIANYFQNKFIKNKKWSKKHIAKKRRYLKLKRTQEEIKNIIQNNCLPGNACYTIDKNSASTNLPDGYILNCIAWRNKELADAIKKELPELIDLKRQKILLIRKTNKNEQRKQN